MKMLLQTTDYKEIDIELPFYSMVLDDDNTTYVKIDETEFKKMVFHMSGKVELFKCKTDNEMANIWYQNKCDKLDWDNAINNIDECLKEFKTINHVRPITKTTTSKRNSCYC